MEASFGSDDEDDGNEKGCNDDRYYQSYHGPRCSDDGAADDGDSINYVFKMVRTFLISGSAVRDLGVWIPELRYLP